MLIIREDQMKVFRRAAREDFVRRMISFLHQNFAHVVPAPDVARIERELEAARRFGLTREDDLRDYLGLSMVYGENFISRPEQLRMKGILSDSMVPDPHQRMHRLYAAAIVRLQRAEASAAARDAFDRVSPLLGEQS